VTFLLTIDEAADSDI